MGLRKLVNYLVYCRPKSSLRSKKYRHGLGMMRSFFLDSQVSCLHLTGGSGLFLNVGIPIPDYTVVYPITE